MQSLLDTLVADAVRSSKELGPQGRCRGYEYPIAVHHEAVDQAPCRPDRAVSNLLMFADDVLERLGLFLEVVEDLKLRP